MRIISGKNKGRKIIAPDNLPVRPTTDFAKEALFNILRNQFRLEGIEVLDLFAGTGNISYEFASRDAQRILCVDNNIYCTKFIQQTANKLNYKNLIVIQADYKTFLKRTNRNWDLIFADPPYNMEDVEDIPSLIFDHQLLKPEGILIVEHKKSICFNHLLHFYDHRVYGNVNFSFFKTGK